MIMPRESGWDPKAFSAKRHVQQRAWVEGLVTKENQALTDTCSQRQGFVYQSFVRNCNSSFWRGCDLRSRSTCLLDQSCHRASKDRTCSHYLSAYHHEGKYLNFGLGACARCTATSGHMCILHQDTMTSLDPKWQTRGRTNARIRVSNVEYWARINARTWAVYSIDLRCIPTWIRNAEQWSIVLVREWDGNEAWRQDKNKINRCMSEEMMWHTIIQNC